MTSPGVRVAGEEFDPRPIKSLEHHRESAGCNESQDFCSYITTTRFACHRTPQQTNDTLSRGKSLVTYGINWAVCSDKRVVESFVVEYRAVRKPTEDWQVVVASIAAHIRHSCENQQYFLEPQSDIQSCCMH